MTGGAVDILVACGSGIATSSVAAEAVKKICEENGIPANVHKGVISNLVSMAKNNDIVITTSKYTKDLGKPVIMGFGLISGIGADAISKRIVEECKGVMEANK
ncbi:MAG: PTS sugar transporter subunit IIB [Atopobiaceae bacterium]|jgi:PTS system galactitol-specific IIB component|nr:PTS sugar transporter subunit IIB [Atopobiaceae bacterium]MCH4119394.1 PTS sugar transporter subunit IIB [Atopobiaceae bacterium]MCI1318140.1 PTS sugar transporter subunit IIB [Atopobiaceae bacterium]MCI1388981.1 PTS sugar transporter subunit IIB [Atopobiaceae bacterium]MCI1431785.1 PTS sugar transporter subunit IIB [Atopobiaceae bacterium]